MGRYLIEEKGRGYIIYRKKWPWLPNWAWLVRKPHFGEYVGYEDLHLHALNRIAADRSYRATYKPFKEWVR